MIFTWNGPCPAARSEAVDSRGKKPRQHVPHMIRAAKDDRKHTDPVFGLVHVESKNSPVDRQMAQARQQVVVAFAANRAAAIRLASCRIS